MLPFPRDSDVSFRGSIKSSQGTAEKLRMCTESSVGGNEAPIVPCFSGGHTTNKSSVGDGMKYWDGDPRAGSCVKIEGLGLKRGRDESKRQRAESQWIVAARPLCHLQYPVAYLSRLQRILPAARWELRFKEAPATCPPRSLHLRHVPLGAKGPYCGSAIGRRARASLLARILT